MIQGRVDVVANFPNATGGPLVLDVPILLPSSTIAPSIIPNTSLPAGANLLAVPAGAQGMLVVPAVNNAGAMKMASTFWFGPNSPTLLVFPTVSTTFTTITVTVSAGPAFQIAMLMFF